MSFEEYVQIVSDSIESDENFKETDWLYLTGDTESWRMAIDIVSAALRDERAKVTQERETELNRIRSREQTRDNGIAFRKAKSKADGQEARLLAQWERLGIHRAKMQGNGPGDRVLFLHEVFEKAIEGVSIEDLIDMYDEYLSTFGEADWMDIFEK